MRVARQKLSNTEIAKRKREGRYHDGRRPLTAKIVQRLKSEGRYKDGFMPGLEPNRHEVMVAPL
jgi:hypothetical protein